MTSSHCCVDLLSSDPSFKQVRAVGVHTVDFVSLRVPVYKYGARIEHWDVPQVSGGPNNLDKVFNVSINALDLSVNPLLLVHPWRISQSAIQ